MGDTPPSPGGTHARGRRRSCACSWTSPPRRGSWLARSARFCGRKVPSGQHWVAAAKTPPPPPTISPLWGHPKASPLLPVPAAEPWCCGRPAAAARRAAPTGSPTAGSSGACAGSRWPSPAPSPPAAPRGNWDQLRAPARVAGSRDPHRCAPRKGWRWGCALCSKAWGIQGSLGQPTGVTGTKLGVLAPGGGCRV